jgi:C-terminal processing protease CtpA/Prc
MLKSTLDDIKNNYYDPKFHGMNIDARFAQASAEIDRATTFREAVQAIEGAVSSLKDSHTHFAPPAQPFHAEYGYRIEMIGDGCYLTHVQEGSDAAKKNVQLGDRVDSLDGQRLDRSDFADLMHSLSTFAPRSATT